MDVLKYLIGLVMWCSAMGSTALPAGEHHHPVGVTDGVAALDVYSDNDVIHKLTAHVQPGTPTSVLYARSIDHGVSWSADHVVDVGALPHQPKRTADLQIAAAGEQLIAAWSTTGTGFMGSGPLVTVISHDGGKSWSAGSNPADDNSTSGHSFVDLAIDGSGRVHAAWLDNRSGKQGLIYSASDDGGRTWATNRILDPVTCECCWNTLFATGDQVGILYRASSPRDMRLFSSHDRGTTFAPAVTVGAFDWDIQACPHVGGAITGSGAHLHAMVWTGVDGKAGVYHLHSPDSGKTWSEPHLFPIPRARQATISMRNQQLVLASTADDGSGAAIWAQTSPDNGATWALPERLSPVGAEVAHPKAVATSSGIRVFWTERIQNGAWTVESAGF